MTFIYAMRYLQIVPVVPTLCIVAFVATVAGSAATLTANPAAGPEALTPVLLLQMFAASSGFIVPAQRGYYDLLLTSGARRWQIALAHYLLSILPGLAAWVCVGLLELAASHGAHRASFASGTCLMFLAVSSTAWSATVPMSRSSAAVGWLLFMTIGQLAPFFAPLQLLGIRLGRSALPVLAVLVLITMSSAAYAVWRIVRGDAPLETAQ